MVYSYSPTPVLDKKNKEIVMSYINSLIEDLRYLIHVKKICYKIILNLDKNRNSSKVRLFIRQQLAKLESLRIQFRFLELENTKRNIKRILKIRELVLTQF